MGMVANTMKVPQGLWNRLFTTARDRPARVSSRMNMTATPAVLPATVSTSLAAMVARLWPLCLTEANSTTMSCTAPPMTQPMMIQRAPGRKPNWAASTGPSSGPAAAMAAKWCPKTTNLLVFT